MELKPEKAFTTTRSNRQHIFGNPGSRVKNRDSQFACPSMPELDFGDTNPKKLSDLR